MFLYIMPLNNLAFSHTVGPLNNFYFSSTTYYHRAVVSTLARSGLASWHGQIPPYIMPLMAAVNTCTYVVYM